MENMGSEGIESTERVRNTRRLASPLVGVVLGLTLVALRPMFTGLGLTALGLVASLAVGWMCRSGQ